MEEVFAVLLLSSLLLVRFLLSFFLLLLEIAVDDRDFSASIFSWSNDGQEGERRLIPGRRVPQKGPSREPYHGR